jgi:exopolysaccharide biosynthesis polyprenyl glycosylphosphotransferase
MVGALGGGKGSMMRLFGYRLAPDMLLLWLVESGICFVALLAILTTGVSNDLEPPLDWMRAVDAAALLALTIGLVSFATGLYRTEACLETRRLLVKATVAAAISLPAIWLVGKAVHLELGAAFGWSRVWPLEMLLAWTALLFVTRLVYAGAVHIGLFARRVLVVGPPVDASRIASAIEGGRRGYFRVVGTVESFDSAQFAGSRPWAVIIDATCASPSTKQLGARRSLGVRVVSDHDFWERHLGKVDVARWAEAMAGVGDRRPGLGQAGSVAIRVLDVVAATLLLVATLPLSVLTALLIKLDSQGPVLYRQERVGLDGRIFTLCKFRSMRTDAEEAGPAWAVHRDPRVTRVGGLIRRLRIDELPQLFNVLSGEMSLVGPRPERPHFVEQLAEVIPGYRDRTRVKPGVTGWAQVNYPYGASVEDARAKLAYDLYYVKHRSLLMDVMILISTVRVVLFQEGAR